MSVPLPPPPAPNPPQVHMAAHGPPPGGHLFGEMGAHPQPHPMMMRPPPPPPPPPAVDNKGGYATNYEGYFLKPREPAAGGRLTWAAVQKERLEKSQKDLATDVRKTKEELGQDAKKFLLSPAMQGYKQSQVEALVNNANKIERDPDYEWDVAMIKLDAPKGISKNASTKARSMTVIIKRGPKVIQTIRPEARPPQQPPIVHHHFAGFEPPHGNPTSPHSPHPPHSPGPPHHHPGHPGGPHMHMYPGPPPGFRPGPPHHGPHPHGPHPHGPPPQGPPPQGHPPGPHHGEGHEGKGQKEGKDEKPKKIKVHQHTARVHAWEEGEISSDSDSLDSFLNSENESAITPGSSVSGAGRHGRRHSSHHKHSPDRERRRRSSSAKGTRKHKHREPPRHREEEEYVVIPNKSAPKAKPDTSIEDEKRKLQKELAEREELDRQRRLGQLEGKIEAYKMMDEREQEQQRVRERERERDRDRDYRREKREREYRYSSGDFYGLAGYGSSPYYVRRETPRPEPLRPLMSRDDHRAYEEPRPLPYRDERRVYDAPIPPRDLPPRSPRYPRVDPHAVFREDDHYTSRPYTDYRSTFRNGRR